MFLLSFFYFAGWCVLVLESVVHFVIKIGACRDNPFFFCFIGCLT